jgi:hypothetical protein
MISAVTEKSVPSKPAVRFDIGPLVLLIIPILVLLCDRSIIFNFAGYLDSWIYFAYFRHLAALKRLFPYTYYGSRLSWILPGYLVHLALPPLIANYVLHLAVWYCAVLSLYVVIKHLADRRSALLSAAIFGFYPYLWKATGWDYPDGAGIAYYLLTAALLTRASRRLPSRPLLALAGASCAGAVYCNLSWAFLIPFFLVFWLSLQKARGYPLFFKSVLLWSGLGAASLTVLLALVNHRLEGLYQFYLPSVQFALGHVNLPSPYKSKDMAWILHANWLIVPAVALLLGLIASIRCWRTWPSLRTKLTLLLYANLVFFATVLTAWEIKGQPLLEIFYYASYLIPPVFLFLGIQLFRVPEQLNARRFYALLAFSAAALSVVWWDDGHVWRWLSILGPGPPLAIGISGLVVRTIWCENTKTLIPALLGLGILTSSARGPGGSLLFQPKPQRTEDAFVRIVEGMDSCEKMRQGRAIRFWTGHNDPNGQEFASIASGYLYGLALYGVDLPSLPPNPRPLPDTLIVIPSSFPDSGSRAQQSLKSAGLHGELLGGKAIARGDTRYLLTFLQIQDDPELLRQRMARGYPNNGDFESGTSYWTGGWATLRTVDGGQAGKCLELLADQGGSQYAMQWDLVRLEPGARYELSFWVKSGSSGDEPFRVGLWDNKAMRWVAFQDGRSAGAWMHYTLAFTSTSENLVSCKLAKSSATKGSMLFDTVKLSKRR